MPAKPYPLLARWCDALGLCGLGAAGLTLALGMSSSSALLEGVALHAALIALNLSVAAFVGGRTLEFLLRRTLPGSAVSQRKAQQPQDARDAPPPAHPGGPDTPRPRHSGDDGRTRIAA